MARGRQVQLRRGPYGSQTKLDLNGATFVLLADGGFVSAGEQLEIKCRVEAATLTELERVLAPVRQMLTQAEMFTGLNQGEPVEVWTKTCDAVDAVAEIGATWLRKRVLNGTLIVNPLTGTADAPSALVTLSLQVGQTWRRGRLAPMLVVAAADAGAVVPRSDGGITSVGAALTIPLHGWTDSTGLTVRVRWLAAAGDCTFLAAYGTDVAAWWDNTAGRFKMQDNAGTPAVVQSSAYTLAAGQEVDVVFRWNPGAGMDLWVDGVHDGTGASCTFDDGGETTLFEPTGAQSVLSIQAWPAALTDGECGDLFARGRPEPELAFIVPASDAGTNTDCQYALYNMPGDAPGGLRVLVIQEIEN